MGDDGGGETGDETGAQVEGGRLTRRELALGLAVRADELFLQFSDVTSHGTCQKITQIRIGAGSTYGDNLVHAELGHGVRDLLEQDGAETGQNTHIGGILAG